MPPVGAMSKEHVIAAVALGVALVFCVVRLALYPPQCLEYVVVHELCHFFVRNHGPGFKMLMDTHLPNWRESKKLLER